MPVPPSDAGTVVLEFNCDEAVHDIIVAELSDVGFHAFARDGGITRAYVADADFTDASRDAVDNTVERLGLVKLESVIAPKNWNEVWESSVEAVDVGPFRIRPSWRPAHADSLDIVIDPKMSFGTAHHESTRLMLRSLPELIKPGDIVLDAGTGTGVLAVASIRLGARRVDAFDIDPWSVANAQENMQVNGVSDRCRVLAGDVKSVAETYSVILANINRNVLFDFLPRFAMLLEPDGQLAMSGLLKSDRDEMARRLEADRFSIDEESTEGAWWSVVCRKD